jgi:Tol biopolymer transport system component
MNVLRASFIVVLLTAGLAACGPQYMMRSQNGPVVPASISLASLEKPAAALTVTATAVASPTAPSTPAPTPTPVMSPTPFGGAQHILFRAAMAGSKGQDISAINNDGSDSELRLPPVSWARKPVWSPDGGKIAILSDYYYSGHGELYIADIFGNYDEFADIGYQYSWSPDSRRIAFVKADEKEIFVLDIDGQDIQQLTDGDLFIDGPAWSPDGNRIAFYATSEQDRDGEIYVLSLDDKRIRQLTTNDRFDFYPHWSADGEQIAFVSRSDFYSTKGDIYVVDAAGNNLRNVSNYEDHYSCFDWSPIGQRLIFTSGRNGNLEIYGVDADGNHLQNITTHEANDGADGRGDCSYNWSPDGTKIVFTSTRGDADIYVMNADGSDVRALARSGEQTFFFEPVWQPAHYIGTPPPPSCAESLANFAREGNLKEIKRLVEEEKCDVNAFEFSRTPLMRASERGQAEVARYLIEKGADINFQLPEGTAGSAEVGGTALWLAVRERQTKMVELLLDHGADPNLYPKAGLPLLILTVYLNSSAEIARLLVEAGIDVNQTTSEGDTVMTYSTGPSAETFEYLTSIGIPTTGLNEDVIESLQWELKLKPAPGAADEEQINFLITVGEQTKLARSRDDALKKLREYGPKIKFAVPRLLEIVENTQDPVRDWAIAALIISGPSDELTQAILNLLKTLQADGRSSTPAHITDLLGKFAPVQDEVLDYLISLLQTGENQFVRLAAADTLSGLLLRGYKENANPDAKLKALTTRALAALTQASEQDPDELVRQRSQLAINTLTPHCLGNFSRAAIALTRVKGDIAWGDYDNDGDLDILLNGEDNGYLTEVWRNDGEDSFNRISTSFPGITGEAAWGDYDNDGDLDLLLAGWTGRQSIAEIWRNDGQDTFNPISAAFPGVTGPAAWGDYDNDGDLDLILSGRQDQGDLITQIWRNDGLDAFTPTVALTGIATGDVAWGDYDYDGDLDLLLSGCADTNCDSRVTEIWRNHGRDSFSRAAATLPGLSWSNVAWGDYDNDQDLDILLNGMTQSPEGFNVSLTQLWRNDGQDTFSPAAITLPGFSFGAAAWGDYDNDGDLDILLAGGENGDAATEIWRNDNQDTFSQFAIAATGLWEDGDVAWGDYDNDGDLDILLAGCIDECVGYVTEVWRHDSCAGEAEAAMPRVIHQLDLGVPVADALIDPTSNRLYLLDNQGGLRVLDLADHKEVARLETGFQTEKFGYVGAGELSIDPGRNLLYISNPGSSYKPEDNVPVRLVDTKALTVATYANLTGQVTPDPTHHRLYLTHACITHILDADTWAELDVLLPFGAGTPHPIGNCLLSTQLDVGQQILYGRTQECSGGCTGVRISLFDLSHSPQYISSIAGQQVVLDPLHQRLFTWDHYFKNGSRAIGRYDMNNFEAKPWSHIDASGLSWQTLIYDPEYDRLYADSTGETDAIFDGDINLLAKPIFPGALLTFDPKTHYLYSGDEAGNLYVIAIDALK